MIRPVASGRLFSVYGLTGSRDKDSQEQEAIARLEETRRSMLAIQTKLHRTRADSERFGESQGDPAQIQEQLRSARREYDTARTALAELRARQQEQQPQERRQSVPLQSYLEQRAFARDFPDDAQRLKTYQIYDNTGNKTVFSASSLEFLGATLDVHV